MADQKIFCNVPWTNLHIYWDGSYGVCCSENKKPYDQTLSNRYNLLTLSVEEWFNNEPMLEVRKKMLGHHQLDLCYKCYKEEQTGYESRRFKENFKSVIFTEQAFEKSFKQSPTFEIFEGSRKSGITNNLPIDWHVDLGNECNLACKMCFPRASSKIAAHYKRWNILDKSSSVFTSWTDNEIAFQNFLQGLRNVPNLNRIHFMGGEPLLNKRFESIIDFLIDNNPNTSISFVTNGTIINQKLIDKLLLLRSCDIEISIEAVNKTNDYIRQGSKVEKILNNIDILKSQKTDKLGIVLRTVPQLLNINSYFELIDWCFVNRIPVQGNLLYNPTYLRVQILPEEIRNDIKSRYNNVKTKLERSMQSQIKTISTGRSLGALDQQLLRETNAMIALLDNEMLENCEPHRYELIKWLNLWDKEYQMNALDYYPEYADFFIKYGYERI